MKFKLMVNASILDNRPSGLGIYTKNIIKELNKLNDNFEVFSPVDIDSIKVKKINKYVKPEYKKMGAIMRILWTQFILPFRARKSDIIYHPFQYLSLFSSKKQIITIHDFIPLYYPNVAKHQNIYYKYIMPKLLKKAYKIICISENTKEDLLKFYDVEESKIKVIYNGYDKTLFNKKNVKEDIIEKYNINYRYMIMVGAAYKHKNLYKIIEVFSHIEDKTDINLVIVGKDSEYILELKELAKKCLIEDRVKFMGYVSDEDLVSLYGYSEAFIYPTLYEGFGLPILEAMGTGTAVICGDNSSLLEVAGDAAITFNSSDSEDIEKTLMKFINNKDIKKQLQMKGEKRIELFSWKKTAEEVYEVLNS